MAYIIIVIIILWLLFRYFRPNIEIIQTNYTKNKVILWYNHMEGIETKRRWVKLFEY
jgi:hypothetical protein